MVGFNTASVYLLDCINYFVDTKKFSILYM